MLKKITILLFVLYLSQNVLITDAKAPDRELKDYTVKELVSHFSKEYQVSEAQMLVTMSCESGFKERIVGDNGKSFGLSQIHLPSHPYVTKEQAFDKVFAVEFMAKAFSKKQHRMWTCWRMYYS